jgi:hypothetical protein
MITYKIYTNDKFEALHIDFFNALLASLSQRCFLSPSIDEIIITDDLPGEIYRYSEKRFQQPRLTIDREFKGIAKSVDFDGKTKIFFDANYVNAIAPAASQIFYEQLIEEYSLDFLFESISPKAYYTIETEYSDIIKILFHQWAGKVVANATEGLMEVEKVFTHDDGKMFVDSFKRNIKKIHYEFQADVDLPKFWVRIITELDFFVRRCHDVLFDNGSLIELQEFVEIIPKILNEVKKHALAIIQKKEWNLTELELMVGEMLKLCNVNYKEIKIIENPKKLFRNNIDTESRIVVFMDILGFKKIIDEYESNVESNVLKKLHDTLIIAIDKSIEIIHRSGENSDIKDFLEYRMFSDCICISLPYIDFGRDFHIQFQSISIIVKNYQLIMMQEGFYVRGAISMGSYYSDRNMIFSGGLVNAYSLEQKAVNPIVVVDDKVLKRLERAYTENSGGLSMDNSLMYHTDAPDKVFTSPFDLIDKLPENLNIMESTLNNLTMDQNNDTIASLLSMAKSILTVSLNSISEATSREGNMNLKQLALEKIQESIYQKGLEFIREKPIKEKLIDKVYRLLNRKKKEISGVEKDLNKLLFLESLIKWSIDNNSTDRFQYYPFIERK